MAKRLAYGGLPGDPDDCGSSHLPENAGLRCDVMNFAIRLKRINSLVPFVSSVALAGCTVGPHYKAPAPPSISSYTSESQPVSTTSSNGAAGSAQTFRPASPVAPNWWTLFGSPQLDAMVQRALANSPTLTEAAARLKQAQEELNARTGATKYPA